MQVIARASALCSATEPAACKEANEAARKAKLID
jgi:hypothetical protein